MDQVNVLQALIGSGPIGVFLAYLAWERRQDKTDRKEVEERRLTHDERRLEADLRMTAALTALAMKITGRPDVDP
jgi:hypothetical protein